jgi:hypothetical protein
MPAGFDGRGRRLAPEQGGLRIDSDARIGIRVESALAGGADAARPNHGSCPAGAERVALLSHVGFSEQRQPDQRRGRGRLWHQGMMFRYL